MEKKPPGMMSLGVRRTEVKGRNRAPLPGDMMMLPLGASAQSISAPSSSAGQTSVITSTSQAKMAVKREPVEQASSIPAKKPKLPAVEVATQDVSQNDSSLLTQVLEAEAQGTPERIEPLLVNAARALKGTRGKPDVVQALSLLALAKSRPHLFRSEQLLELLMSILKKEFNVTAVKVVKIPSANNPQVQMLTANLVYSVLREENVWSSLDLANGVRLGTIPFQPLPQLPPLILQLIDLHEDNLSPLPVQCLCEYLLCQIYEEETSSSSSSSSLVDLTKSEAKQQTEKAKQEKDKKRKLRKVICHLWTLVNSESTSDDRNYLEYDVKEIIEFLSERLGCQSSLFRLLATKSLRLILSRDYQARLDTMFSSDNSQDEQSDDKTDFDFLDNLMMSRYFDSVKDSVCDALKYAILIELNPEAVNKFTCFLSVSSNPSDSTVAETIAHLIIDRPSMVKVLTQNGSKFRDTFITSCSRLFLNHLKSVKRRNDGQEYNWSNAQDKVIVQWESLGESAILNIFVVHAMILLLTMGPVSGREDLFAQIMSTWFCQPPPQVLILDTSEEALVLPDWLRLRLLRTTHATLVQAALRDLDSVQLVLFIQSFGLPIASIEKLLQLLDECCEEDEDTVRASIPDEKFMKHLIQVQWSRGVRSGTKFAMMLGVEKLTNQPSTSSLLSLGSGR